MDKKNNKIQLLKFIVLSLTGVFLFFIPVKGNNVPITVAVNWVKSLLGDYLTFIPIISVSILFLCVILGKAFKIKPFSDYMKTDGTVKSIVFCVTFLFVMAILLKIGPEPLNNPAVGGRVLPLAANVMITIALAGWGVIFILKSGIVEFISVLVEPFMRPVFKLPGEAAVNCLSSFVSSASVGVYFTEQYYKNKKYTEKEAIAVLMNFSVISVGYMGVLVSTTGIEHLFGTVITTSFVLVLIMAVLCVRIPPISLRSAKYIDGAIQTVEKTKVEKIGMKKRFALALEAGIEKSKEFTLPAAWKALLNALRFSQKIVGVMISCVVVVLTLVNYTDLFIWLGKPFIPILKLFGMREAAAIAPSIVLGFVEVSLPSISISGANVAPQSAFFVVMMSILQVVFMTEAGNAMLSSELPVKFKDLVLIFLQRTLIAIPLVACATWILF